MPDPAKCLHVNLEPEDIDIAHRMKKGNLRARPIVVRFTNYYSRRRSEIKASIETGESGL